MLWRDRCVFFYFVRMGLVACIDIWTDRMRLDLSYDPRFANIGTFLLMRWHFLICFVMPKNCNSEVSMLHSSIVSYVRMTLSSLLCIEQHLGRSRQKNFLSCTSVSPPYVGSEGGGNYMSILIPVAKSIQVYQILVVGYWPGQKQMMESRSLQIIMCTESFRPKEEKLIFSLHGLQISSSSWSSSLSTRPLQHFFQQRHWQSRTP